MQNMVSQNVIPSLKYFGGAKVYAFTEQGVAMLSSVLRSKKAIQINISIMRAFVMMRQWALTHQELSARLDALISFLKTKTLVRSVNKSDPLSTSCRNKNVFSFSAINLLQYTRFGCISEVL